MLTRHNRSVPPNVSFEVDDANERWTYDRSFDYIHVRQAHCAIKEKHLFAEAFRYILASLPLSRPFPKTFWSQPPPKSKEPGQALATYFLLLTLPHHLVLTQSFPENSTQAAGSKCKKSPSPSAATTTPSPRTPRFANGATTSWKPRNLWAWT